MAISFIQVGLVLVGLYMVVISIYDMMRDTAQANLIIQGLMIAIGGGIILYGFNVKIAKDVVKAASQAVGGPRP